MHIESQKLRGPRPKAALCAAAAVIAVFSSTFAASAQSQTLDRIREQGAVRFGYIPEARPFTFNGDGSVDGYAAALCEQIAGHIKVQLRLQSLRVEWVPVTMDNRLNKVAQGDVDLLCTPTSITADRRQEASFSVPIFAAGNRIVLRADAPAALRNALSDHPVSQPVWRGSPAAKVLQGTTIASVAGTTTEKWLAERRSALQVDAKLVTVRDPKTGVQQLLDRQIDALVADRTVVLSALDSATRDKVIVLDRMLTHEPAAFAMARGDEDFRLVVDNTLSELFASDLFPKLYQHWVGPYDESVHTFFSWNSLTR